MAEFSAILNTGNITEYFNLYNDTFFEEILSQMDYYYNMKSNYNYYRENHLLEYLVYDFKDEDNKEIYPEGNGDTINKFINKYGYKAFQNKVINYINCKLKDPSNIKIVLFSKYKFLVSSKYMKKYFEYLINYKPENQKNECLKDQKKNSNDIKDNNKNKENNKLFEFEKFKKSQIIYMKESSSEKNYIKIIYFIEKINNQSYTELFYKSNYFNYIYDILSETKEGSLYSLLTKNGNFKIKKITSNYNSVLAGGLSFYVVIELISLNDINDIIFMTYQYINKIIEDGIGENLQIERYLELREFYKQSLRYTEKSYDTIELASNNGKNIFETIFNQKYYFYLMWCPWEEKISYEENIDIIRNETYLYFKQLIPENSIIILGIRENEINDITCNKNSYFPLDCSYFKNKTNIENTKYYNISYANIAFNASDFKDKFDIDNKANISYVKNNYISNYTEIIPKPKSNGENTDTTIVISQNILNTFYFKKNMNFRIPKVFISINLLHPYLRPLVSEKEKYCYYFQILEIFSAIERKAEEVLANALRAGNEITFDYNENYLTINILCYEDASYNIAKEIKKIIFDTNWNMTDFINNNKMYKNITFDEYLNFGRNQLEEIAKYYFYSKVKNGLFNKYEFNAENFDSIYNEFCFNNIKENIDNLNKFVVNGLIYGYMNQSQAEKISKLFDRENYETEKSIFEDILKKVNNNLSLEEFIEWNLKIKTLNETGDSTIINKVLSNKLDSNRGFRYLSLSSESHFSENFMKISLLENMFNNIISDSDLSKYISIEMFTYRDIYFGLYLEEPNDKEVNPNNDTFINYLFDNIMTYSQENYSKSVDNIGDRFYYFQKNFKLVLFKKQVSLEQKANEELKNIIYNYSIPSQDIISNKNYKFKEMKLFFEKISKNKYFDVNTSKINETIT